MTLRGNSFAIPRYKKLPMMWHDDLLFDIRISQEVGQLIHGNIDFCHWRGVVDVLRAVQIIRGNILAIEQV